MRSWIALAGTTHTDAVSSTVASLRWVFAPRASSPTHSPAPKNPVTCSSPSLAVRVVFYNACAHSIQRIDRISGAVEMVAGVQDANLVRLRAGGDLTALIQHRAVCIVPTFAASRAVTGKVDDIAHELTLYARFARPWLVVHRYIAHGNRRLYGDPRMPFLHLSADGSQPRVSD